MHVNNETYNISAEIPSRKTIVYNPSLAKFGDDMLVVSRVEWKLSFQNITSSIIVQKIPNCDLTKKPLLLSLPFDNEDFKHVSTRGYEDPRIFITDNKIYSIITTARNNGTKISFFHISDDLMTINEIIEPTNQNKIEKNWNPLLPEKGLFVTDVQPHTVVYIDKNTGEKQVLYKTMSKNLQEKYPRKFGIRGSSKYIELDDCYLAIAHSVQYFSFAKLYYYNIAYCIEKNPPYKILSFSDPFRLTTSSRIEFVSGLEKVGNDAWISFGVNDENSHISVLKLTILRDMARKNVA